MMQVFRILLLLLICYSSSDAFAPTGKKTLNVVVRQRAGLLKASRIDAAVIEPKEETTASSSTLTESTTSSATVITELQQQQQKISFLPDTTQQEDDVDAVYKKGLATIAMITVLFASNSPVLHAAFGEVTTTPPPVLFLNAACSLVAMVAILVTGPFLNEKVDKPALLQQRGQQQRQEELQTGSEYKTTSSSAPVFSMLGGTINGETLQAGAELGLWKFLGTVANLYGLSLTSADHGAFLIQLTTLFVPLAQGILGVPIPTRIWTAIGLALTGVAIFTQDGTNAGNLVGDAFCVGAAVLYATYDLRLFHWGKRVEPLALISTKIVTQTTLSMAVLAAFAAEPSLAFVQSASLHDAGLVAAVVLWSGLAVNAVAPYLQVGGQQAVGPARAQILYASQPLWAALLSWLVLGETVGRNGMIGGTAFIAAMFLAATADVPDPDCGEEICET